MKPIKIIFLDCDGVLNRVPCEHPEYDDHIETDSGPVSKRCVNMLNKIVKETGAKIVVSSVWRYDGEKVFDALKAGGVEAEFVGLTGRAGKWGLRGNEIRGWIQENEEIIGKKYYDFREYVILDDDSDMLLWQKDNFINVDPYVGITESVAFRAIKILNRYET